MTFLFIVLLLAVAHNVIYAQGFAPSCPASCIYTSKTSGKTYDLSGLKDVQLSHYDEGGTGATYTLTLCGTDKTTCPSDANVPSGMAVQYQSASQCFVLAVYNQDESTQCAWSENQETASGGIANLQLAMSDGTPTYCGSPRSLTINFQCPADKSTLVPKTFQATNPVGTCNYIYTVSTCAVCDGGCPGGGGFGSTFFILFFVGIFLYLLGGGAYNYSKGVRGLEMVTNLWPTTFVGYVKDGIAFTMSGCKSGNSQRSQKGVGDGGDNDVGDTYQPYQNI
jgi:hypothetical protein